MDLSIVIPAYNESHRLPQTLREIRPYLDSKSWQYEVLIVDDGSTDKTLEIAQNTAKSWSQIKVMAEPHGGKGSVVKAGCLAARGKNILIIDADHPTPIETLEEFIPKMKDHDMVVGVRAFCGEEGASGRFRRIVGLAQQLLAHIVVFQKSVADSQCGFKLLSQNAAKLIFSRTCISGGMFDVELFFISQRHNLRIFSQPVKWVNKEGSTINILRCIIFDPFSLFYIRWMDLIGKYK